jgi:hypothetical protein
MNVPSFSLGNLAGRIEVTRTVTALTPGVYRAKASVPGVKVAVTPSILSFNAPGEKRTFKVSFENQSAALGLFAMGSLTWEGSDTNVVSPIAVRPQSVVAPKNVAFSSTGGNGSGDVSIVSGTDSATNVTLDGLSKADSSAIELVPGPFRYTTDASNFVKTVEVPAGAPLAKLSVFSADEKADFDMVVITPGNQAIVAATASASETVSIPNPAPGTYRMHVNLYDSPGGQATKASVDAAVLGANVGNATVAPDPVRLDNGRFGNLALSWQNLAPGSYIGRITFDGASAPTFVSVVVTPGAVAGVPPASEDPKKKKERGKVHNEDLTRIPDNSI